MARTHGRARRGRRLRMGFPNGHWKTTTVFRVLPDTRVLIVDRSHESAWFCRALAEQGTEPCIASRNNRRLSIGDDNPTLHAA